MNKSPLTDLQETLEILNECIKGWRDKTTDRYKNLIKKRESYIRAIDLISSKDNWCGCDFTGADRSNCSLKKQLAKEWYLKGAYDAETTEGQGVTTEEVLHGFETHFEMKWKS